jgi:hypothetical protein
MRADSGEALAASAERALDFARIGVGGRRLLRPGLVRGQRGFDFNLIDGYWHMFVSFKIRGALWR